MTHDNPRPHNDRTERGVADAPTSPAVAVITVITALSLLAAGAWARFDPASFAEFTGWENHVHFLHDAGVFQLGIGLMMLAGFTVRDTLTVGLGGFVFVNTFHAINHALDHHLGGSHLATWFLLSLSVLGTIGFWLRVRQLRRLHLPIVRRRASPRPTTSPTGTGST